MWIAGITQGLMWKEFTADGMLAYPSFIETVTKLIPMYWMRAVGGSLYLTGMILMVINVIKTVAAAEKPSDEEVLIPEAIKPAEAHKEYWHAILERKPILLALLTLLVILIGGVVEMVPTFLIKSNVPSLSSVKPYTPLEIEGRDIYVREGCYTCHSQMIRPFRDEVERYGEYSKPGEFVYDHPFQWGSKRTGPDLHRVGGKFSNLWHVRHFEDPRVTSPGSIMPSYHFLLEAPLRMNDLTAKMKAMRSLGVPYSQDEILNAEKNAKAQAEKIGKELEIEGLKNIQSKEVVALIAYLQRLGTDIKGNEVGTPVKVNSTMVSPRVEHSVTVSQIEVKP